MPKPGVMIYFDVKPCLSRLSLEEKGALFDAVLEYAESGVLPEFEENVGLGIAFDFMKPRIDRDTEHYEELIKQRIKASRSRRKKQMQCENFGSCECCED